MPKVVLARQQIVDGVLYKAGEQEVPAEAVEVLESRDALVKPEAPRATSPAPITAPNAPAAKPGA